MEYKTENMRLRYLILNIALVLGSNHIFSQDIVMASKTTGAENTSVISTGIEKIEFSVLSLNDRLKEITPELAGSHLFGNDVAKQEYLFNNTYTYKVQVSPGNPTLKTMTQKPTIYTAVRKIEKQLKKDLRGKKIDAETASLKYSKVLEIAICVFNLDTVQLEEKIKGATDGSDLLNIFTEEIRLNYIN